MEREEFDELSAAYAIGSLAGDELRSFEQYLATASPEELTLVGDLVATASLMPLALKRTLPPAAVKQQLMQKINLSARAQDAVRQRLASFEPLSKPTRSWMPWGIAASLAMVVMFSFFVFQLMGTIERQNTTILRVEQEKTEVATRLVALRDELTIKDEQLKVLSAKQINIAMMDGMKVNPVGYGKIIWDPEKGTAILQVSHLPAAATNKDYQLWVIKDKKPISAGVFAVNDTSSNFFKIQNMAVTDPKEIAAFAVTLEPKGGMPQPTGDMYMMGSPKL